MIETTIEFFERGDGYPQEGDILLDHSECAAYRVLPDIQGTGQGNVVTHGPGRANTCALRVEILDYDDYFDFKDCWEI